MVKVKICGITDFDGIEYINEFLPDYAGFVFAESRRQVNVETAGRLAEKLNHLVGKVGVFVNAPLQDTVVAVDMCRLDAVQLHGDETPEYLEQLRALLKTEVEIWKAVRVKDQNSIDKLEEFHADRFLLDAYMQGVYGGAGITFNWKLAAIAAEKKSIILAGGLNPENAQDAVRQVRPFALDVSSGVETDGKKDREKIRRFINAVRSLE